MLKKLYSRVKFFIQFRIDIVKWFWNDWTYHLNRIKTHKFSILMLFFIPIAYLIEFIFGIFVGDFKEKDF